jgi:hypothetical protein
MLDVYADFAENWMAMPVIKGEKTAGERFPGAVATYSIEAMMQDRKALQAGTSHFLGQNFSKAQEIKFQEPGRERRIRLDHVVGRLHAAGRRADHDCHSDDDGLVLPPQAFSTTRPEKAHQARRAVLPCRSTAAATNSWIEENTRRIDTLDDFRAFFPKDEEKTISGGFALCHFTEGDETMKQILAELKVTPRCIPLEGDDEPGKCLFTGQPSRRRAVFAKAY